MLAESERAAAGAGERRRSRLGRREAIEGYVFIGPWLIGLLLFTLGPFLAGFYFSFTDFDGIQVPAFSGLSNFQKMVADPKISLAAYNTIYYVLISVPLNVVSGLLLAILLNQKVRGITFFRTAYYVPAIVPAVPSIALFLWLLHDRFGLINEALFRFFNIPGPHWLTSPEWAKPALILWSVWGVGAGMIIYLAGLQGV